MNRLMLHRSTAIKTSALSMCQAMSPSMSQAVRPEKGAPRLSFGGRLTPRVVLSAALLSIAACASSDGSDGPPVTGESARDVNWAFTDKTVMEQKLADLQTENATLKKQLATLRAGLRQAQDAVELAETEAAEATANAAELRAALRIGAQGKPAPQPVISAPSVDAPVEDAPLPIASAPRLVQPTFASGKATFENEAGDAMRLSSVLWGVHLDSYSLEQYAREGWRRLQRAYPDELGLLEPRTERVMIDGKGEMLRLIGGGFATEGKAEALCSKLTAKNQYCRVVSFGGERLSLATPRGDAARSTSR